MEERRLSPPKLDVINAAREDSRLQGLIDAYRKNGHRIAQINPLVKTSTAQYIKDLDPQTYSLKPTKRVSGHTVEEVVGHLRDAYCGPMGVEFMHLDEDRRTWFAERYETLVGERRPSVERRKKMAEILLKSQAVSPVALGKARARLQSLDPSGYLSRSGSGGQVVPGSCPVLPVQVHGDASFAAQGVIMETLALSKLPGFGVGGSVHLVVNNQIGFTTPARIGRSSPYVSDVMKMISAPVIHVNGDDPEAVALSTRLALEYRQAFGEDVLLDMLCFRRWGHNEMDDPTFTNPLMYDVIHSRSSVPDEYAKKLREEGSLQEGEKERIVAEHMGQLNEEHKKLGTSVPPFSRFGGRWSGLSQAPSAVTTWDTGVPTELLKYLGARSVQVPPDVMVHPHLNKVLVQERLRKIGEGTNLEWATAEALSFGSLLYQGFNVRICGQDVGRGTFSQRHSILVDRTTERPYVPLNNLLLSEEAVLSFEYGFSLESPRNLVIWEAQFGDFHNSAQVVVDTFVTSGEAKWFLQSGMVVLLPHGFDGAGPEHSSCRIERFLQMTDSKEDAVDGDDVNFSFVHPTTPAQYFHLLRRQMLRNFRKPLVVASPKILLRHPAATSSLAELAPGTFFRPVLGEAVPRTSAGKVLLCSGKHYYALAKQREELGKDQDVAIVRLEALCPFPAKELAEELSKYTRAKGIKEAEETLCEAMSCLRSEVAFEGLRELNCNAASTRPLDLEHRKAGTPRAAVKVLARGGAAAQRSLETVPRREVRPRNRRPLGKSCLQRRGTGPNPRGTETGPTKAPDTAWLPTATAARKSVLDANHEPLRLTHIRNHAHGNQLQGIPWLPPPPAPTPNLSRRLLASAFLLPAHVHKLEPVPDRGNSHQARHTQQVGSPNSHTRPKTGWGKALSRPLVTPRAGRDGVDGCSPLAGKGADATGLLAVRDPAMLGTPPDGDQSQDGRTRSDCLSTRGTARV
ncbi:hypothetical protein HPB47_010708 [Ixodes persulcatus]|uniref:Uncharacterized protein n=1 Tax=Ixodes persulcatus TaxID=34615 RepID=A0AC60NYJ2_IXOPE|nr:hypothetical protein HPB47_010708 [Ixodes persulcatus]